MAGVKSAKDFNGMMEDLAIRLQTLRTNVSNANREPASQPKWAMEATEGLSSAMEELKVAEEELLAARTEAETERYRYRDLFEFAPDGYLITDGRGTITEANRAAATLLNVPESYVVGKPLLVYVQKEDRLVYWQAISRMRHEERGVWQLRLMPRRLKPIIAQVTVGAVRSWEGSLEGLRWIIRDVTEQQRIEEEVTANRLQLRKMTSELSLAEERERRRLANEIHDHIGQTLAMIKMKLGAMRREPGNKACVAGLTEVTGLVTQTISQTRSLSFELSPPLLYDLGLEAALQWLTENKAVDGIRFDFKDDGTVKMVSDEVRVLLFQAVRELLTNIVKHAKAKNGTVSISAVGRSIVVEVQDDGVGLKRLKRRAAQPTPEGFGLFSLRERLTHLGGQMEIISPADGGLRVRLTVPLSATHHAEEREHYETERVIGG